MSATEKGFLTTADKIRIAYELRSGGFRSLVVICPGFFNSMDNRWMKEARRMVAQKYDTLIFDFRGHGRSSGKFTWTAREHLDLETVLEHAAKLGYASIGILGFSLGAAVSINTVSRAICADKTASMVLISPVMSFWEINYHFWEPEMFSDLADNFSCGWEGKGVRWANMFLRKPRPINRIKHIKNIPVMFVHGTKDWIVKDIHSRRLFEAYKAPADLKKLVLIKGGLHAERLIQKDKEGMRKLIMDWFAKTLEE